MEFNDTYVQSAHMFYVPPYNYFSIIEGKNRTRREVYSKKKCRDYFTAFTISLKALGSFMARSARTFLSSEISLSLSLCMKVE